MSDGSEDKQCTLLGGPFELSVQVFLAATAVAILIYKRHIERPPHRRPWLVWSLDCSKQAYASALQHGTNLILGVAFASSGDASECAWYLLNFAITVVCGIAILSVAMTAYNRFVERYVGKYPALALLETGEYGTPPSWKPWLAQSLVWGLLASGEKVVTAFAVILPLRHHLDRLAAYMEGPILDYPKLELVLVMVVGPMILNAFFFWIIDSIIMRRRSNAPHEAVGEADVSKGSGVDFVLVEDPPSSGLKSSLGWSRSGGGGVTGGVVAAEALGREIV